MLVTLTFLHVGLIRTDRIWDWLDPSGLLGPVQEAHSLLDCADLEVSVSMSHLINTDAAYEERTQAGKHCHPQTWHNTVLYPFGHRDIPGALKGPI